MSLTMVVVRLLPRKSNHISKVNANKPSLCNRNSIVPCVSSWGIKVPAPLGNCKKLNAKRGS